MTPGIQLSNMTRLALVVALVLAAVLAVHFLTRHPGLQSKPLKLSLCCLAVLVLGSAGLYAIAQTGPDARRLEGFDALAGADGGSAASLLESIADMDSLPGAEPDAGAVSLRLDYDGGRLAGLELRAALAVEDGVWLRDYAAGADGTLSTGMHTAADSAAALPFGDLAAALRSDAAKQLFDASGALSVELGEAVSAAGAAASGAALLRGGAEASWGELLAGEPGALVWPLSFISGGEPALFYVAA